MLDLHVGFCFIFSTTTANGESITDKGMSLIQRRFHKSHSQTLLKPSVNALVVPRPRPFSDISNDLNDKSVLSPPLTPPLVAAKPPVSLYKCKVSVIELFVHVHRAKEIIAIYSG